MHVLGISGSLRAGSFNTALLRAAVGLAPHGLDVTTYDRLRDIPPYDQDLDTERPPAPVADLRASIFAADGLLIATPEYNYGIPGVLKNALDWASRPAASSSLKGRPIAIMGASPSQFGTVRAQLALRQAFLWTDSAVVTRPEVHVFTAHQRFGPGGELIDGATRDLVVGLLLALVAKIRERSPSYA